MEKKFLLYAVSLILIVGESYSTLTPNTPTPNTPTPIPFPNRNRTRPIPNPATPIVHNPNLRGPTSSGGRVVTRPPVPTAPKVSVTFPRATGAYPHIILRAEQPREIENISRDKGRSISESLVIQLEQMLKPEYMVDMTGSVGNVMVTVVPKTADVIDDGSTIAHLTPEEILWIEYGTLLDLPNKIIPGSRIEFDVVNDLLRNLRFYPPKHNHSHTSSSIPDPNLLSPQSAAPLPHLRPYLLPVTVVTGASHTATEGASASAPSTTAVDELSPIDFDLPAAPTDTAAAPMAYAHEILDPSFGANAPAPVSQTATVVGDEVAADTGTPSTTTANENHV